MSEEEFEDGRAAVQMLKTNLVGKPDALLSKLLAELLPSVFEDKGAIEDLRKHLGEGCHIEGHLLVNKVAGHFPLALQKADHHVLMTVFKRRDALNVSHLVHSISFGEPYPGMRNPLDGQHKVLHNGSGFFQYYIKVVPTIYEPLGATPLRTNQYSYTELFRTTQGSRSCPPSTSTTSSRRSWRAPPRSAAPSPTCSPGCAPSSAASSPSPRWSTRRYTRSARG